ncbi:hypothetical protein ARMSODRAFT_340935 [Armillaria solidipes]|uniref:Uncharacterized protein n=1 Tax=Armillaria solidipes TaxID=1076256 RepID=A0A2H3BI37_9AGAR|nr:hypothetical protein ARMSODRAFT_340935 [Armillaria solidipes]
MSLNLNTARFMLSYDRHSDKYLAETYCHALGHASSLSFHGNKGVFGKEFSPDHPRALFMLLPDNSILKKLRKTETCEFLPHGIQQHTKWRSVSLQSFGHVCFVVTTWQRASSSEKYSQICDSTNFDSLPWTDVSPSLNDVSWCTISRPQGQSEHQACQAWNHQSLLSSLPSVTHGGRQECRGQAYTTKPLPGLLRLILRAISLK